MIDKAEFIKCAKQFIEDESLQKLETQNFIFIRPNGIITVKFKEPKNLTGYFTIDEFKNEETLGMILNTLETELQKNKGENNGN